MTKEFAARRLDVKAFAEEAGQISGTGTLAEYPRLMAETQERGAGLAVQWAARGELRNAQHPNPEVWLHLNGSTVLPLTCQRCLAPVDSPVEIDRTFRFVADEETAAAQDDEAEEDLLVLSRSFDLLELVEDEILMELPVAPRHDVCPEPVKMAVADPEFDDQQAAKDNPFALLKQLKTPKQ